MFSEAEYASPLSRRSRPPVPTLARPFLTRARPLAGCSTMAHSHFLLPLAVPARGPVS